jgi:hypothetical protein
MFTIKKSTLESVRQISRQKPEKASVVRQPKKVYCEMIGMGAKSNTSHCLEKISII